MEGNGMEGRNEYDDDDDDDDDDDVIAEPHYPPY